MNFRRPPIPAQAESPIRFRHLIRAYLAFSQGVTATSGSVEPQVPSDQALTERVTCCSTSGALSWVQEFTSDALGGDESAPRLLPEVIAHYLIIIRRARL